MEGLVHTSALDLAKLRKNTVLEGFIYSCIVLNKSSCKICIGKSGRKMLVITISKKGMVTRQIIAITCILFCYSCVFSFQSLNNFVFGDPHEKIVSQGHID